MVESPRVKICGLTNAADMRHAVDAGADYLGLVFAPSPRRVDPADLDAWLDDARGLAELVGVFRDASVEQVVEMVEQFDLDFVQLHGREHGVEWSRLPVRLIEARVVAASGGLPGPRFPGASWADLLDGGAGDGKSFDWDLAIPETRARRVFLAGGLRPDNVADAVRRVRPFAVDVSSGVESRPGRKDPQQVAAFVRAAKEAGQ
jgi:phosphoribosylanthranilate isomerase